jgi:hypothetical protein
VDLHQHLWPEALIRALESRAEPPRIRGRRLELAGEPGGEVDYRAHSLDGRLALLDRHEIETAVVSLAPTLETEPHPDVREAYHEGILEVADESRGRLLALAAGERRPGFAGACVSATALVAGVEDLLTALEDRGELLFVHPGPPGPLPPGAPPWWPAVAGYTAQMQAAYLTWLHRDARRHPRLPVVFAILAGGAPVQLERLRSRGVDERTAMHANVFFDTASYGRRALELCLSTYGIGQLVFGSDAPVIDPGPTAAAVRGFGKAVERIVLRENGRLVLRLDP